MSKKIIDMTPEEIRLEVAKARGIRAEKLEQVSYSMWLREWLDPGAIVEVFDAGACCDIRELPDWTKRIEHAWELVEEMIAAGNWVQMHIPSEKSSSWLYLGKSESGVQVVAHADTAPLAICRAYLIWRSEK